MTVITVDIETFWSRDVSLSKLPIEEYINHPRFEIIGVSVKVDDGPTMWFSDSLRATKAWLGQFPWATSLCVAHNAQFDVAILSWIFDIHPPRIACTLSMARAVVGSTCSVSLDALATHFNIGVKGTEAVEAKGIRRRDFTPEALLKYGDYCSNDVELTHKLFGVLQASLPLEELKLIDLTTKMFTEPVLELDEEILSNHLEFVKAHKQALIAFAKEEPKDIRSNIRFAQILSQFGVALPMKTSPTTGKQGYAFAKTDEAFVALAEHPNLSVQALVAARLGLKSTIEETRTERFIGIAQRNARVPIPLRYYAAHTGRWGGDGKLNVQNLQSGSEIKDAIKAPAGYYVVNSDSSQIEARVLAWLSGQTDLVTAFEDGEDVYKQMASTIYSVEESAVDKAQRYIGKTTILSCGYGCGWRKFQGRLKQDKIEQTEKEAKDIITTYRTTYKKIPELWNQGDNVLDAIIKGITTPFGKKGVLEISGEGIKLPNGLYLRYPNLRVEMDEKQNEHFVYDRRKGKTMVPTSIWGGTVVENVCQALARIIIGEQMLKISKKYRVCLTVHDSVVSLVPIGEIERATETINILMRLRPSWGSDLPLNCETHYGPTYGSC